MKKQIGFIASILLATSFNIQANEIDESFEQRMLKEYTGQAKIKQKGDSIETNYKDKSHYLLSSYKQNYFLPISYGSGYNEKYTDKNYDNIESKFQISVKYPLALDVTPIGGDLYFTYTNRSNWQMYSSDNAFREISHEPEILLDFNQNWEFGDIQNTNILVGFNHQTNGQSDDEARQWDRIFADFIFAHKDYSLSARIWYPINDDNGASDNNHDITDYIGYHELNGRYYWNDQTFSAKTTWAFHEGHFGVTLGWEKPITPAFSLYVEGFTGYGDSMIDFDERVHRIGVGFIFTNDLF